MEELKAMQVAIYVAVGANAVGQLYAEQPKSAYYDSRNKRPPYSMRSIEKLRGEIIELAKELGLDPDDLPPIPFIPYLGA